jgi:hypothetical protein
MRCPLLWLHIEVAVKPLLKGNKILEVVEAIKKPLRTRCTEGLPHRRDRNNTEDTGSFYRSQS